MENQTENVNKMTCTKCKKEFNPQDGSVSKSGFICDSCQSKKKKNTIIAIIGVIIVILIILGIIWGTSTKSVNDFNNENQITDSMTVKVDEASFIFKIEESTAINDPIYTQSPLTNLKDFELTLNENVAKAEKGTKLEVLMPSCATTFLINTADFVNNGEELVKSYAEAFLKTNQSAKLVVEGYTCDLGTASYNNKLSKIRAEAVKDILVKNGVNENSIEVKWYGESRFNQFNYAKKADYRRVIISVK